MGGDLEQLWYTWTTHGLDSGRGFQVRAASARFHDRRDRALTAALRYCYRPPGERAFGWIERDGHRIVFNRVDAGRHSVSGGGNFFVHLILGTQQELPTGSLWSLYDAPFWQTCDPGGDDLVLPKLRMDERDLVGGRHDVGEQLPGFLAFLLHCIERRSGMQIPFAPDVAAALAAAAAAALPDGLGLLSFSTGESSSNAREYDIVRSDVRPPSFRSYTGPDDAAGLPTVAAAETLLDTSAQSRALVAAIAAGPAERREFVRNLITAVTFREGGDISTDQVVHLVSAWPEALNAMLDRKGMVRFADDLARGDNTALTVLPRLGDNHQRRAARRVARAFADDPVRALGLLRTTVRVPHASTFTRETAKEVLERALGDGLLTDIRWADVVEFIRVLAGSGAKLTPLVEQLLTEDRPRVAVGVATHTDMPTEWRVTAALQVPSAFSDGRFDRALAEDVEFAWRYLRHRRDDPLSKDIERITRRLDPTSAWRWLHTVEPYIGPANTDRARWTAIDRTSDPDDFLGRLYEHSRGLPTLESAVWEKGLRTGIARSIESTVRSSARSAIRPWTNELDMLDRLRPRSSKVQAWTDILHLCQPLLNKDATRGKDLQELARYVLALHGEERDAAALLALERVCYAAPDVVTFGLIVQDIRKAHGDVAPIDWVYTVVYTAARMPAGKPGDRACQIVGRWALSVLRAQEYRPKQGTQMRADLELIADRMPGPPKEDLRRFMRSVPERLGLVRRNNRD